MKRNGPSLFALVFVLVLGTGALAQSRPSDLRAPVNLAAVIEGVEGPYAKRVREIARKPVLHCKGPAEAFPCHSPLLDWLLAHPVWVNEYWRTLGMPVGDVAELSDGFEFREDNRARVTFHIVETRPGLRLVYCVCEVRRPPLPALKAELVIAHRYHYHRQSDGQEVAVQQLESFTTVNGPALRAMVKLTQNSGEKILDQCLEEMMIYFSVMCRLIQIRPDWAKATLAKIESRLPRDQAGELRAILDSMPAVSESAAVLPAGFLDDPSEE